MSLTPGTRLGPYEIVGVVGAGGMGEVYRARDARLGRDVAIKVLPQDVATDPDRLRRFEQEARAAAALNHSGILAVHDIGEDRTTGVGSYIVTELLEGQTLRDLLLNERLSLPRAVDLGAQIADALAAAHGRGIVHRDIKPENIFVTVDGRAKILDFGLAKSVAADASSRSDAETTMRTGTDPGVVLGTAGYMAPEQLRAQSINHRTDIFAFGAVLYEMLSARRAFGGGSALDTASAILRDPVAPMQSTAERPLPPALLRIIDRCLEKSPAARFQSTIDLAFALKSVSHIDTVTGTPWTAAALVAPARSSRETIAWTVAAIAVIGLIGFAVATWWPKPPAQPQPIRFTLSAPPGMRFGIGGGVAMAVSPDGTQILFAAQPLGEAARPPSLFVRSLSSTDARRLAAAEAISPNASPFWSPDGRSIGFWNEGKLRRLDLASGVSQVIGETPPVSGPTWGADGTIVYGSQVGSGGGLNRIAAAGGAPSQITTPDLSRGERVHSRPAFLPDGRHFLLLAVPGKVCVGSLDSPDVTPLLDADSQAVYSQGHVLFVRQSTLLAQPFDPQRLQITGEPVALAEDVQVNFRTRIAQFAVSPSGVLVYQPGDPIERASLAWFDRKGNQVAAVPNSSGLHTQMDLMPDEHHVVASMADSAKPGLDLWWIDLDRGTRVRLTSDDSRNAFPVVSPDGTRVLWASDRAGVQDLYWKRADGVGLDELFLKSPYAKMPTDWTGHSIVFVGQDVSEGIFVVPDSDPARVTKYSVVGTRVPGGSRISPNGQWMAYGSNESGRNQIFVQSFPEPNRARFPITGNEGGTGPRWRADGGEIVYTVRRNEVMAVSMTSGPQGLSSSTPTLLFRAPGPVGAVTRDNNRFLVQVADASSSRDIPLTVVVNWTGLLPRK